MNVEHGLENLIACEFVHQCRLGRFEANGHEAEDNQEEAKVELMLKLKGLLPIQML